MDLPTFLMRGAPAQLRFGQLFRGQLPSIRANTVPRLGVDSDAIVAQMPIAFAPRDTPGVLYAKVAEAHASVLH